MKVLISGGYGFIGSHVADRFHKEGYEVFIIDNMSTGRKENINFKHKGYQLSVEDPKCEEIFRSNRFDAVVHLAAQVSVAESVSNPRLDTESNVLGLVNMLTFSKKYNVKKFLFASSAAVYGMNDKLPLVETDKCDPISPYGISKWVGESYCLKWSQLYELDTVCFRFSNVYGPRQGSVGEGGVISIFMDRVISGQTLYIHGDGEQTRDFIYVEDVADAIYRASYSSVLGVYNLSTNSERSINSLVDVLKELQDVKEIKHTPNRAGDITRSTLSNEKIKAELDWSPMYDTDEGLSRTYAWFQSNQASRESAATATTATAQPSSLRTWMKSVQPYAENVLAFALTAWIVLSQQSSAYGLIDVELFYITIIGIIYGNRQSILAVVLSIGLFLFKKLNDGHEIVSLMYDTDFFFQIAIYLFIGLVVGYSVERRNRMIQAKEQKIDELEKRYEFLNGVYTEVREVKDELQQRILNSGDSFGKIHSITKELESLELEKVFMSTVNVVKSIMDVQTVSIYTLSPNRSFMRLVAHTNVSGAAVSKSLRVEDHAYIQKMLADGKVFVNKELNDQAPLMSVPVYHENTIAAFIAIEGMSIDKFSLYYQNLFKVTSDLVSSALSRALAYYDATESRRFIEGTSVLRKEAFEEILSSKKQAKSMHNTPYLLLEGELGQLSLKQYSEKVASMLRETDYIGTVNDGQVVVILSNSAEEDANFVLSRFAQKEISMRVVEGEL
ncbi:NAD-dependent epimerase/dehydratase family protein [Paenibacillus sinopodophylli]|uniref:NAD-dependent epimerase/dehydratase family protein n=1 Tax=Paenibacillus sinopodophylli TaxID=1837342 RepID=UPI001486F309|nr:NAD-dependent epimerase/dehydratase family protein [Paenibacillus sinopodophylli]